jgi:hypothetical protein
MIEMDRVMTKVVGLNGVLRYALNNQRRMILFLDFDFRLQILRRIKKYKVSKWFLGEDNHDQSSLGISAIQQQLEDGMYTTPHAFSKDVKKVGIQMVACSYSLVEKYFCWRFSTSSIV